MYIRCIKIYPFSLSFFSPGGGGNDHCARRSRQWPIPTNEIFFNCHGIKLKPRADSRRIFLPPAGIYSLASTIFVTCWICIGIVKRFIVFAAASTPADRCIGAGGKSGGHENSATGFYLSCGITVSQSTATGITPATDITISSPGGKVYTSHIHAHPACTHTRARPVLFRLRLLTLYWISRCSYQVCSTLVNPLKTKWSLDGVGGSIKVD